VVSLRSEQAKSIDSFQVTIERDGVVRPERPIDAADQGVAEIRFRGSEVAQCLPGVIEALNFELRRREHLLERPGNFVS
jgi:hypothetical protein